MFIFSGKLFIKMASVHPEMYFNVEDKVTCLAFIKENQILIGTTSGKIQLWSLKSQSLTKTFELFSDKGGLISECFFTCFKCAKFLSIHPKI